VFRVVRALIKLSRFTEFSFLLSPKYKVSDPLKPMRIANLSLTLLPPPPQQHSHHHHTQQLIFVLMFVSAFMFCVASVIFVLENSTLNDGEFVDMLDTTYFFWVVCIFFPFLSLFSFLLHFFSLFLFHYVTIFFIYYFFFKTFTTIGYGDLTPETRLGRGAVIIFIMACLATLPWLINLGVSALQYYDSN